MSSQWGSQKLLLGLVSHKFTAQLSVFNLFSTQTIIVTLSKGCKPDKSEPHYSLKLSFANISGLCSNFAECESFVRSNSPSILALFKTNLNDSIDSSNFPVRGHLPLIWTDSITFITFTSLIITIIIVHGLAVYVKEGLSFAQDLYLENWADSYLCFWLALLHSVSYFFFFHQSPPLLLCTVFDSISSNIDEILLIKLSAAFVFGYFDVHHKDWQPIMVELIYLVNSVINCLL